MPRRRLYDRFMSASVVQRALASLRSRSGVDADLDELRSRIEALERARTPLLENRGTTKAYATPADADLLEEILLRLAGRFEDQLRAFEWGSGLSTLHYPEWLASRGVRVSWITAEHDRAWFMQALEPVLRARGATIVRSDDLAEAVSALRAGRQALVAVVFDNGPDPHDQPSDWYLDRALDRDEYVALPCELGLRYHVALVDGRQRRRCLLEAAKVLEDGGVALLHDAQRPYYHSAFAAFRSGRRIGDELWIGAQFDTDFSDLVPADALSSPGYESIPAT